MLEIRLVLKNIRNQLKQYFVYFVGIIIVMTLLIMYLNFSTSVINSLDIIKSTGNMYALSYFIYTLIFVSILIFVFLLFILIYGNKMMRKLKAREYGLYKLYGISNKRLFKLILLEQMIILLISFMISLIVGVILTTILVKLVNMSIKDYLYNGFVLSLSFKNYIYVLIILIIEALITSYLSYKAVRKKEVISLINEQTNLKPAKMMSTSNFWFYVIVCIIIYTTIIYALEKQLKLLNADEILLILLSWGIVIYLSYKVLAYLLIKILPKRLIYKNENLFTLSIINRKLSSSLKAMSFITIFLIFLFVLIFVGSYMQNSIKMNFQQEDVVMTTSYDNKYYTYNNKEYKFNYNRLYGYNVKPDDVANYSYIGTDGFEVILESDVNRFLKENNFSTIDLEKEEAVVVNPGDLTKKEYIVQNDENIDLFTVVIKDTVNLEESNPGSYGLSLLIVADENIDIPYNEVYENKEGILEEYKENYDYGEVLSYYYGSCDDVVCYNYVMISESDINKYFELKKYDMNMNLKYGEFGLIGTLHDYNDDVENWEEININGKLYPIVKRQELYIPNIPNTSSNFVVISDEQVKEVQSLSNATYEIEYLKYKDEMKAQDKAWSNLKEKRGNISIKIKSEEITELYLSNMVAISFTTFISFVILILLICILAMQTTIDSIENKKEFAKLKNINYTNHDLRRSVNKITFVYFIVPFIMAAINLYIISRPLIQYLDNDTVYLLQFMNYNTIIFILIVLIIIYILFFILINYSYKKVVIKK